jgi:hypothetical protein
MARPIANARRPVLIGACLVSLVVAACGSTLPLAAPSSVVPGASSSRPTFAPIGNSAPTVRPSPRPSVSVEPTPAASPSLVAAALPRHGRIEVADSGYAITLPTNWYRTDLTAEDLESFARAGAGSLGSGLSQQLASQIATMAAARISLFALRFPDGKASAGTNLNIAALPSMGLDLDTLESLNLGQLATILGKDTKIAHSRVRLPAGEAVRIAYTLTSASVPGGTAGLLQHLVVKGDRQIIVTCTAPGGVGKIATECDRIARSLEFVP